MDCDVSCAYNTNPRSSQGRGHTIECRTPQLKLAARQTKTESIHVCYYTRIQYNINFEMEILF